MKLIEFQRPAVARIASKLRQLRDDGRLSAGTLKRWLPDHALPCEKCGKLAPTTEEIGALYRRLRTGRHRRHVMHLIEGLLINEEILRTGQESPKGATDEATINPR